MDLAPSVDPPERVAATFCATLVDEWARAGVAHAVVCPGSRSTPLALALAADPRISVSVHHDERSGGFAALGVGLATGVPAVVVTTSGTAAVHLHAAVVEAHHSAVPLLAVTADRPPELHDVGAPQTIAQVDLFGSATRWAHAPGVADQIVAERWRPLAARAVVEARGGGGGAAPGPVHLDLAFREPLVADPGPLPPGRPDGAPWVARAAAGAGTPAPEVIELLLSARRGALVLGPPLGPLDLGHVTASRHLADVLGWPLLVDARARGAIGPTEDDGPVVVGPADALLRVPGLAADLAPDVVLHLGAPPASRVVNEWIAASGATEVRLRQARWVDPHGRAAVVVDATAGVLGAAVGAALDAGQAPGADPVWVDRWRALDRTASAALDAALSGDELTEPGVARTVLAALVEGEDLVVSSSMPVRDLEWYGTPRSGIAVVSNRGTNGIDGIVSTAIGVATARRRPTVCLLGDVALLHDSSALAALAARDLTLTIVVVDNDGGGIFSFLPQARAIDAERFEALFGTPHGTDLRVLAAAHGMETVEPATSREVGPAVRASLDAGGVRLVRVRTDRGDNVEVHARLHAAVAAAVTP